MQGLFLSADGAQGHVDRGGLALANHSGFMANNYWDGVGRIENKREKPRLPEGQAHLKRVPPQRMGVATTASGIWREASGWPAKATGAASCGRGWVLITVLSVHSDPGSRQIQRQSSARTANHTANIGFITCF